MSKRDREYIIEEFVYPLIAMTGFVFLMLIMTGAIQVNI